MNEFLFDPEKMVTAKTPLFLAGGEPKKFDLIRVCAWCVTRADMQMIRVSGPLSHGICGDCRTIFLAGQQKQK